jgi:hypothetical protein
MECEAGLMRRERDAAMIRWDLEVAEDFGWSARLMPIADWREATML